MFNTNSNVWTTICDCIDIASRAIREMSSSVYTQPNGAPAPHTSRRDMYVQQPTYGYPNPYQRYAPQYYQQQYYQAPYQQPAQMNSYYGYIPGKTDPGYGLDPNRYGAYNYSTNNYGGYPYQMQTYSYGYGGQPTSGGTSYYGY